MCHSCQRHVGCKGRGEGHEDRAQRQGTKVGCKGNEGWAQRMSLRPQPQNTPHGLGQPQTTSEGLRQPFSK